MYPDAFDLEQAELTFGGRLREQQREAADHGDEDDVHLDLSYTTSDVNSEGMMGSENSDAVDLQRMRRAAHGLYDAIRQTPDDDVVPDDKGLLLQIRSVPRNIWDSSPVDFEPKLVHLGALLRSGVGAGDSDAERLVKYTSVRGFLRRSSLPVERQLDEYLAAVASIEERAKSQYYGPECDLCSEDFVVKMVVDGCFILEFLINNFFLLNEASRSSAGRRRNPPVSFWDRHVLARDVLLLENQVPFCVLQTLFDKTDFHHTQGLLFWPPGYDTQFQILLSAFYYIHRRRESSIMVGRNESRFVMVSPDHEPHHLLDFFHQCLVRDYLIITSRRREHGTTAPPPAPNYLARLASSFYSCFATVVVRGSALVVSGGATDHLVRNNRVPCATELWEAGVRLKKKEGKCSLLDITFRKGTLEIPHLVVDENSCSCLHNLVTFERCFLQNGVNGFEGADTHFTSYAICMHSILSTAADVEQLERSKIIRNNLGGREEVVKLFKRLAQGVQDNFIKGHYLASLYHDVSRFHESSRHRWWADLKRNYFSSPWSALSLVAACVLLLLTLAQTLYTVLPYYQPTK